MTTSNVNVEFVEKLSKHLKSKEYELADALLKDTSNHAAIQSETMEVILEICESGLNEANQPKSIEACRRMLVYVCGYITPKLGLVALHEQAEAYFHSPKFSIILEALGILYPRHQTKTSKTYAWTFQIIKKKLELVHQFPAKYHNKFIEGKEILVLEQQPEISSILEFYKNILDFFKIVVSDFIANRNLAYANKEESKHEGLQKQGAVIRDYLVDLLGPPLVYFDLSWNPEPILKKKCPEKYPSRVLEEAKLNAPKIKSEARLIAESIISLISEVNLNSSHFMNWADKWAVSSSIKVGEEDEEASYEDDDLKLDFVSVGNYFYLVYAEKLNISNQMSMAFAPEHVLRVQLPLIIALLEDEHKNSLRIFKGVRLAHVLIADLKEPLESHYLQGGKYLTLAEKLNEIVIYCESREVRKLALEVLKSYFWSFNSEGKHLFLKFMLHSVKHSGLISFMIGQLKDCVHQALALESPEADMKKYFLGDNLSVLLKDILNLPNGPTTDLMDYSDRIIGSLNLLIYLLLRDKSNETGLMDQLPNIETNLLKPLRTGLDLSISHYQLKLKEINEPGYKVKIPEMDGELVIGNNNTELDPEVFTVDHEKKVVCGALSTFDLIASLHGRVNECISASMRSK